MEVTFADGTTESYRDQPFAWGTQGRLFLSFAGEHVAKFYIQSHSIPNATRMEKVDAVVGQYNITGNEPYWSELYAWPDKRIASPTLGIRMPFMTGLTNLDRFFWSTSYTHLPSNIRGWWIGRVAAAAKLARAVNALASKGIVHSDLSDKTTMVDLFSGRIRITDCDALVVPGELAPDVLGTPGYMAPELIGQRQLPSAMTDRHALAVLLYRLLLYRHPLDGPKVHDRSDPDEDEKLQLGAGALFAEHPTDRSNRPAKVQVSIDTLTPRVRDLFLQAFVTGLHNPARRPSPAQWDGALLEMFDCVVPCSNPKCEQRFFVALHQAGERLKCSLCSYELRGPASLAHMQLISSHDRAVSNSSEGPTPGGRLVVGWPGRPLFRWHTNSGDAAYPQRGRLPETWPIARLEYDAESDHWYLLNLDIGSLVALDSGQVVPPQTRVLLRDGLRLRLGDSATAYTAIIRIERNASSADATILRLPQIDTANAKPWPLLQPTQADLSWMPGQPVSLGRVTFSRDAYPTVEVPALTHESPRQPAPGQPRAVAASRSLFISHSHADLEFCRAFASKLRGAGYDIWYDEQGMTAGSAWVKTIEHEIESRDIFVVILTPDAWASYWVQEELQLAFTYRRRVVPILHKPTRTSGFILSRQWVDVIGMDGAAAVERLLEMLQQ